MYIFNYGYYPCDTCVYGLCVLKNYKSCVVACAIDLFCAITLIYMINNLKYMNDQMKYPINTYNKL